MKRTLLSLLVGGSILFSMPSTAASLDSMVENLYGSFTSTNADDFTTASGRKVFSGGAYSLRFRPENINVINFQAPHVGVSCNGIDFFAGSLDLMSKDELVQVGRNIAAAATVYAFRLALNSVCSSCNAIMTNIQTIVQQFNRLAKMSCQDALNVMEAAGSKFGVGQSEEEKEDSITGKILATTGGWAEDLTNTDDNWLAKMIESGTDKSDIAKDDPGALKNFTDVGYLISYNTEIPQAIFAWMNEDDARSALWSVISQDNKCPDENNKKSDGMICGVPDGYNHRIVDFFLGDATNSEKESTDIGVYKLKLPDCNSTETVRTDAGNSYKICNFTSSTKRDNVSTHLEIEPIVTTWMKNVFGTSGVTDDDPTMPDISNVCDANNYVVENSSMFSKLNRITDESLSATQAQLVGIIGSKYTRDLYKLNEEGKTADKSDDVAGCSEKADILAKQARDALAKAVIAINGGISEAIKNLRGDSRWKKSDAFESIVTTLCKVRITQGDLTKAVGPIRAKDFIVEAPAECNVISSNGK